MRLLPWVRMPAIWIKEGGLRDFGWSNQAKASRSTAIAALQLYIALLTQAEEHWRGNDCLLIAELTYTRLMEITDLSRQLVAAGLEGLVVTGRIKSEKDGRKCRYILVGYDSTGNWCKLPSRPLYNVLKNTQIEPFQMFQKRSVCELDALKLFLYFAFARDNKTMFTMASFETISEKTGVAEKRIPRANAFLINCGLLANLSREHSEDVKKKEPNKYFMRGYRELFTGQKAAPAPAPA
ncbi:DNA-binding protein [Pseudomonas sp. MPC6]|uniref:DNA-binding protein n=1 Tax=unclassified Pseudomonas TaxID=196821 RepID=UPI001E5203CF|nr:DNA-binding protein [Pseudomonas sp. MPC6]